jgi:hypothetical protein
MLSVREFGEALLRTQDLDPVYVALHKAALDPETLDRTCLAYWCFYHLGVAAKFGEIKNPKKYWAKMLEAAVNLGDPKPWPRGAERRHFRGDQAINAVEELTQRYKTPSAAVRAIVGDPAFMLDKQTTYNNVAACAQRHRGFGPWIAFKIADMAERVLGYDVNFDDCHLGIYKDPRQGAALVRTGDWKTSITDDELRETVEAEIQYFRSKRMKAPPARDRLVNVQEVESIFCKYKSHVKGHYQVGKDISEIRHALVGWGDLAQQLLRCMPPEV